MKHNLSTSLVNSILSSHSKQVLMDVTESLLDTVLNEGLLKEIPVISSLYNLGNSAVAFSDRLLSKKILAFLYELENQSAKDIRGLKTKLDENDKFRLKLGDKLLYILDKCDDDEKAAYIAKLFSAYLGNMIDFTDFLRLSKSIDLLTATEIEWFLDSKEWNYVDDGKLISGGLLYHELVNGPIEFDSLDGAYIHVGLAPLGKRLRDILKKKQ